MTTTNRRCEHLCCDGSVQCADPAIAYIENDFGSLNWYCAKHIALFSEQARNRARFKGWLGRAGVGNLIALGIAIITVLSFNVWAAIAAYLIIRCFWSIAGRGGRIKDANTGRGDWGGSGFYGS
jgi:hypothetical protein